MIRTTGSRFRVLFLFLFLSASVVTLYATDSQPLKLDKERASKFAQMAMRCVEKEFPNKMDHVLAGEKDVLTPKTLHPSFYGCFDWHSSVHGHWMLIRLLKTFPDLPEAPAIREILNRNLSAENILKEAEYLRQPDQRSFERAYGWAWFLKLAEELYTWNDADGKQWLKNLAPLEDAFVKRYMDFLPKQIYPVRTGVHPNTAFALGFALDYARTAKNKALEDLIIQRSTLYYSKDRNCPCEWEPSGEDFFSPCLMEASLMQRILKPEAFIQWFHRFMPRVNAGQLGNLMVPAIVSDRSDGKLVHLDGLNLSRAWCMIQIANALPAHDKARKALKEAAIHHTTDALKNIQSGDYAGEHWLASFATYLLTM
ncbi:MAG: DUF2891 domain-containing protein [Candidatus Omnitrophota bacterium]